MATPNSTFNVRVNVQDGGDIEKIKKAVAGLGATVTATNKATGSATKSSSDFFDTQKKGVVGTANSTKSFSKLAETLGKGGSSGLVGAYATLAANIFAVTAAFSALRGAAQVEQIFRGLEAAGTRTGLSLTTTAKALREVTGNAIDTEQAMRSTAQIVSAGFKSDTIVRLGQAAKDASFALGRNMQDSLDRLSRGIVKLEPELLDELGIMTKLTDSNVNYARQLGKSESQLTNFEKRQGFANAVLAEAELKFGGLSKAAGDATAYDQLAAAFGNLTNQVFNYGNIVGKPLAAVLTGDTRVLLGVMVLFGSTLKNQIIPGLANAATNALKSAEAFKKDAEQQLANLKIRKAEAAATAEATLAAKANFDNIGTNGPRQYLKLRDAIKAGTTEATQGIEALERSIKRNYALAGSAVDKGLDPTKYLQSAAASEAEIEDLKKLDSARKNAAQNAVNNNASVAAAYRQVEIASKSAAAQDASAASIAAASQLKIADSIKAGRLAVSEFGAAQKLVYAEGVLGSKTLGAGLATIKTGAFAAGVAVRGIGTAFLTILPWIGAATLAFGLIKEALNGLKSDATKKLEAATESLTEVTGKANDYGAELARVNASQAPAAQRAAAAITIQSNAISEANVKFSEFAAALRNANLQEADLVPADQQDKIAGFWDSFGRRGALSYWNGLKKGSEALNIAEILQSNERAFTSDYLSTESKQSLALFNELEQVNKTNLDAVIKTKGGYDKFAQSLIGLSHIQIVNKFEELGQEVEKLGVSAESVKALQEAFKDLSNQVADFSRQAIPTTPYDQLEKSLLAATKAAGELQRQAKNNPKIFSDLLSGLDTGTIRALNIDTQLDLEQYKEADQIVQGILKKREQLKGTGETLSLTERSDLSYYQSILNRNIALGDSIKTQLDGLHEKVQLNQASQRIAQSELAVLNAQVQASSELYKNGAAGLKARFAAEDRIRNNQIKSLQLQISTNESLITGNSTQIKGLEIEAQRLENRKSFIATLKDERNIRAKMYLDEDKAVLARLGMSPEEALQKTARGPLPTEVAASARMTADQRERVEYVNRQLNAYRAIYNVAHETFDNSVEAKRIDDAIAANADKVKSLGQDNLGIQQANLALRNQIKVLELGSLDSESRRAAFINAARQSNSELLDTLQDQAKSAAELSQLYADIDAQVAGVNNRLDYQLLQVQRRARAERAALEAAQQKTLNDRNVDITLAQAALNAAKKRGIAEDIEAANTGLTIAQNSLTVAQQDYNLSLQKIDATERQAILEKVLFDTRSEGLQWQQDSLNLLLKSVDAQRELSDEVLKTSQLNQQIAAKRGGYEISKAGEEAQSIEAAAASLKLAKQEVGIKKALIDLEYALLGAQRDNLVLELQTRMASGKLSEKQAEQVSTVLSRIANLDFTAIADNAKKALDQSLLNKELELKLAVTPSRSSGPFSEMAAAVQGYIDRAAARKSAQDAMNAPIASTPYNAIDRSGPAKLPDPNENPNVKASNSLRDAIVSLQQTIINWINKNPEMQVSTAGSDYSKGLGGNAAVVKSFFAGKALTPSQVAAIIGNLQVESYDRIDPGAKNDSNHAGIVQWDASRQKRFFDMFGETVNSGNLAKQLQFLWKEMQERAKTLGKNGWSPTASVATNTRAFEAAIEVSGGQLMDKRIAKAEQVATTTIKVVDTAGTNLARDIVDAGKDFKKSVANDNGINVGQGRIPSTPVPVLPDPISEIKRQSEAPPVEILGKTTDFSQVRESLSTFDGLTSKIRENLKALGPEGEAVSALTEGMTSVLSAGMDAINVFQNASATTADKITAVASVAAVALSTVQSFTEATAKAKEDTIDREIAAEQKRDGKSAESVAKIASLEKKKDDIAKKQFNLNKKLMMAQALIATATGVTMALSSSPPPFNFVLAGLVGALGAAQLAIIAGTQYQSSASSAAAVNTPSTLTIGRRGDTVDLAHQNTNVGGELGYLRGSQGTGSNASNYSVVGSAYGGDLPRGYGNTAYVVGEKGPETIVPTVPVTVRSANDNPMSQSLRAEFHINAIDTRGVEEMLQNQKGNIISMLREAANANGSPFMEDVNISNYSRPNSASKL